ncbi:hypothetical protein SAMN05216199_2056 [Pedococcus cremeus]|uniref:DUF2202 domain-containing protein n=1 Tax=Pedococcus cremeus TaxID=587636 RepID=A0A1H9UQC2_9MICO|nr:DUF2202 domain-containing protein [Pedococcus cremeus]SES11685.1 hypothetical protein SAMN05216199_2056 [Pedococcus cremeus]
MTLRKITTTKSLSAAVAGMALVGLGYPAAVHAATSATTTGLTNAQLSEMREEERMARDLYTQLGRSSGEPIFTRIAAAEQRHLDAVERLMTTQGMDPQTVGTTVGRYAVPDLQSTYTRWLAAGRVSDQAAYKVGADLEKQDIADLKALDVPSGSTGARVVQALLAGSEHHLAAFTKAVNGDLPEGCPFAGGAGQQQGYGRGAGQGPGAGMGHGMRGGAGHGMGWSS